MYYSIQKKKISIIYEFLSIHKKKLLFFYSFFALYSVLSENQGCSVNPCSILPHTKNEAINQNNKEIFVNIGLNTGVV